MPVGWKNNMFLHTAVLSLFSLSNININIIKWLIIAQVIGMLENPQLNQVVPTELSACMIISGALQQVMVAPADS